MATEFEHGPDMYTSEDVIKNFKDHSSQSRTRGTKTLENEKHTVNGRMVKRYTPAERRKVFSEIATSVKSGQSSLKDALATAGISEQTYYNWKKIFTGNGPASSTTLGKDLQELIELEAENQRLRQELADKLRMENAELRRRLGKV
ncbi:MULTISPECIES: transposase [unclassified Brucella]|uniref:transposase n=1 Tax=unclassified Brucella TaxID=2632610 RepID=UPI0012AD99AE|nr:MULTISPECIES: transposase [unclassified Brucella]MRN43364.1 transposase [Brucella sp. 09RB8913]MRN58474.1 transposase [Brucella sp. 09RB8918]CAB4326344.1 SyrB family protein [Brucella sp. 191011898]